MHLATLPSHVAILGTPVGVHSYAGLGVAQFTPTTNQAAALQLRACSQVQCKLWTPQAPTYLHTTIVPPEPKSPVLHTCAAQPMCVLLFHTTWVK
jgi:hypothetical protein